MKKRTSFPRFFTAVVLILSILAGALLVSCAGNKKEPVLPPVRIPKSPAFVSYTDTHENIIRDAVKNAQAVACVRIGDWLGETVDLLYTTFEAEVIETVRGELPKNIVLLQDGTADSSLSSKRWPIFTAGNELFLFLNKYENHPGARNIQPDNAYYIAGMTLTVCDMVMLDSGEKYVIPRDSLMSANVPGVSKCLVFDRAIIQSCFDEIKRVDPVWNEVERSNKYVLPFEKLVAAIKELG